MEENNKQQYLDLTKILATHDTMKGFINDWNELIENPNEIFKQQGITLQDLQRLTYDPHVSSCIQSRRAGVLSLDWEITESPSQIVNEFIDYCFTGLNIRKITEEMLDAILYGYKPMEVYWIFDNGQLVPWDIVGKPSWWFTFDKYNLLRFNRTGYDYQYVVPDKKILLLQHNATYDNPFGDPLLAKAFYPVLFKKGNVKLWTVYTQKYGMPFVTGKTATNNEQEMRTLLAALKKMQQDAHTVIPSNAQIDVITAGQTSGEHFKSIIEYFNAEISKLLLSQTLSSEQGDSGSYALGKAHLEVRESVVDADRELVSAAFNTLIKWTVEVNFGDDVEPPKFVMFKPQDVDKNLADRDKVLFDMGIKFKKSYYNTAYGFDENDYDVEEPAALTEFADVVNDIPEIALDDFVKANEKLLKPALKLVEEAKSFDEVQSEIVKLFPKLKTDEIEELIANAILIANMTATKNKARK